MPAVIPVTIPVAEPMVAILGILLLQAPPVTASVSAVVAPAQTMPAPPIGAGAGFTVTTMVAAHPVDNV